MEEYGILTAVIVVDKYTMRAKRSTIRNLHVVFYTEDKRKMTVTESASKTRYRNTQIGDQIKLLYSSTNPDIITFNTEPKQKKDQDRLLPFHAQDLMTLIQLDEASASSLLESAHWKFSAIDSIWFYENSQVTLQFRTPETLIFTNPNFKHFEIYEKDFRKLNFETADRVPMNKTTFTSTDYTVVLENSLLGQGQFRIVMSPH